MVKWIVAATLFCACSIVQAAVQLNIDRNPVLLGEAFRLELRQEGSDEQRTDSRGRALDLGRRWHHGV